MSPIFFEPVPMERIWGGRRLETVLGKTLPPGSPVGESWEIVDREDAQSVVHGGELRGATLHELWTRYRARIFGEVYTHHPAARFPILIKLLDARERLSVQVHPPAEVARVMQADPKTEVWYFLDCLPGASIYAGLKRGVSRRDFELAIERGQVEDVLHRLPVHGGESIFVPSGRVHALGEGCLLVEVQQNSDTTYRVFDWNRVGLDGKSRELHIVESMSSIDFEDFEPALDRICGERVCACEHFSVEKWELETPRIALEPGKFAIFGVVEGAVALAGQVFDRGAFFLVSASSAEPILKPVDTRAGVVRITLPALGAA